MVVDSSEARHPATAGAVEPGLSLGTVGAPAAPAPEDPNVLDLVKGDIGVIRLESGQVLFSEGDPADCMYVVRIGKLRIRSGSVIYEDVGPGGLVGEMGLVEGHQPRSAMVYALTESELVQIDDTRFAALIAQTPRFALTVMQVLSRRLRTMDRRYRPEPRS